MPFPRSIFCLIAPALWLAHAGAVYAEVPGWRSMEAPPEQQARLLAATVGTAADAISVADAEGLMLRMVNAARATAGAPAVIWSQDAARMAQAQADAMADGH